MSDSYKPKLMVKKKAGSLWETIKTVIYAVLIAIVIRTFAYEPFNIPSGSMIPTLLIGDYLFVSKFSYGYSTYSFPLSIDMFSGRIFGRQPARGDVVVFKLPRDNKTDYIKRIVGLPGDRIQVIKGQLYINDQPVKEELRSITVNGEPMTVDRLEAYIQKEPLSVNDVVMTYEETLPNGVEHPIHKAYPIGMVGGGFPNNTSVYVVPPGHYFAMGDNRDNSQDSRFLNDVGYVPAENLIGKAQFIFFSTNGDARFWEIWKWPFTVRYGRLFKGID